MYTYIHASAYLLAYMRLYARHGGNRLSGLSLCHLLHLETEQKRYNSNNNTMKGVHVRAGEKPRTDIGRGAEYDDDDDNDDGDESKDLETEEEREAYGIYHLAIKESGVSSSPLFAATLYAAPAFVWHLPNMYVGRVSTPFMCKYVFSSLEVEQISLCSSFFILL